MTRYSPKVGEALAYGAQLHSDQVRKGKDEPYLSHILMVAALTAHYGGDEEQIIAAVLHDAVEDCGGPPVADEIRRRFGDRVAGMVLDCSDAAPLPGQPKPPWEQRKREYIDAIRQPNGNGARLVEACDKLANLRDIIEDLSLRGDAAFANFKGGKQGTLEYYATLAEVLMPQVPAVQPEYERAMNRLTELTGIDNIPVWT
jgi:GTP pyrophosphokinase